jgi:hypothetical protein
MSATFSKTQTLPVSRNSVTSRSIVVLSGTSLSEYALLNVSRTAANDFDARMNTRSARCSLLRKWHEQRPRNLGDLDSNVTG